METFSYMYEGIDYRFVLTLAAKAAIEKLQKKQLKNPAVVKMALSMRDKDEDETGEAEGKKKSKSWMDNLSDEQIAEILPQMDEMGGVDPIDIGYVILSNYMPYRAAMNPELFTKITEDMEDKLGLEETFDFFVRLQASVFTRLAAMQENQEKLTQVKAGRSQLTVV